MNHSSRAESEAVKFFKETSLRVPAYKDFLRKAKVNPDKIETFEDFKKIPPTNKPDYISAYSLKDLSWDGTLCDARYISSSSGSTGIPFYWPRGNQQNETVGKIFKKLFEESFDTKIGSTLFVNLFALGTWIAGLEFYNGVKYVADKGSSITIITPGIEKTVALDSIKRLAPLFDRIVLAGYPPFVKDVLDSGIAEGIDWNKHNTYLLTAGESFSELWREHVLEKLGGSNGRHRVINLYGMAETGVMGHETPVSISIRKNIAVLPELSALHIPESGGIALYNYDPLVRFLETAEDNSLLLTSRAGLPLIRYNTRDQGGLLSKENVRELSKRLPQIQSVITSWPTPIVYLYGRKDLSLSFYALNVYVENIKYCFETYPNIKKLSGLFIMRIESSKNYDQEFHIVVELARGVANHNDAKMVEHVVKTLPQVNSEYSKLLSSIAHRAHPKIRFVQYGTIETIPGKKHRWVKRV